MNPPPRRLPLPSWVLTLAGFGVLIALVLAAFLWQLAGIDQDLHRNTLGRTRMMAAIIEEHLANASQAASTIDAVTSSFLGDKARFVDYLDTVDPLQPEELTALARETGLLGIALIRQDGQIVTGPPDWLPSPQGCEPDAAGQLRYDRDRQTVLLNYRSTGGEDRCVQVGLDARAIVQLRDKTALPVLLANLSRLPGIRHVHLQSEAAGPPAEPSVQLFTENGLHTAEARLNTSMGLLVVGLDAALHQNRLTQLRHQFVLFGALLLALGLFFSWLLYRQQQAALDRTRTFERLLAREHEAAALGRATATIAHEVRNPLNAIGMGLQRLEMESLQLDADQRHLLAAMKASLRRADGIIGELQRFTRKLTPRSRPVDPGQIVGQLLALYRPQCDQQGIEVSVSNGGDDIVTADPDLLSELIENLLKNSIEAQPNGGFLCLAISSRSTGLELAVTNGGCLLAPEDVARLGEPYFTTKTRGTGLGLALCRRIAEAHGGVLRIAADARQQSLTVTLTLPRPPQHPRESSRETATSGERT